MRDELFRKNEKKQLFFVSIPFMLIFLAIIIYFYLYGNEVSIKNICRREYNFVVDSIFFDKSNHGAKTIITTEGDIIGNNFKAIKGDSVVKHNNDSIVWIYRDTTVIKINLLKMYRDYGWIE